MGLACRHSQGHEEGEIHQGAGLLVLISELRCGGVASYLLPRYSSLSPFPVVDEQSHLQLRRLLRQFRVCIIDVIHNSGFGVEVVNICILPF